MDDIRQIIADLLNLKTAPEGEDLSGFTLEQLQEAETKAREQFEEAKEAKDIEAATPVQAAIKGILAEYEARANAETELEDRFNALEEEIKVEDESEQADDSDEASDDDASDENADEDAPAEDDAPAESKDETETPVVEAPEVVAPPAEEPVAVAAAAVKPAAKKVTPRPSGRPKPSKPMARITAAADVENKSPGAPLSTEELGEAFYSRANALLATGKTASQSALASIKVEYPKSRVLDAHNTPEANSEIINPIVEAAQKETFSLLQRMASTKDHEELVELTAAGGLCAPLDIRYDIMSIGDDVRPLRDSLPRFNARRGGIRYVAGTSIPLMEDVDGSVNIYTEEDDTTGSRYPKGCIRVDCPTWEEVTVKAITLCMITGTWQRLTYPEAFKAWWRAGQVLFARTAEVELWDDMIALSKAVTAGEGLGATVDVLSQVTRATQQMKWRYRISPKTPMRLWAPDWLRDIMKTDLARRAPGDGLDATLGASDAALARYFAARNVAVTYVLDAQSPGGTSGDNQAVGALNPWPSTVQTILAPEGTFLGLDMGQLNFGTEIRDFDMIRQNDVGAFYESFEAVAKLGPEALALTLNICPDGTTAGPDTDFDPCTTGS